MTNYGEQVQLSPFAIGDVVQLKSGGPWMTFSGQSDATGRLFCEWFVNRDLKQGIFHPQALKKKISVEFEKPDVPA